MYLIIAFSLLIHFNSSMVRLKDMSIFIQISQSHKFQFLYGSIKRKISMSKFKQILNFNSSMVRLKGPADADESILMIRFQFLYGSIKSIHYHRNPPSTNIFQFLYGSIKSRFISGKFPAIFVISIPLWFD